MKLLTSLALLCLFVHAFPRDLQGNTTAVMNSTISRVADKNSTLKKLNETVAVRPEASYPEDLLTHEQIRKGGFLIYIFGKFLKT